MTVVACIKWLTPHDGDDRFGGISPADASALELALRLAEARGEQVLAITVGTAAADTALRDALACGAARAIRIDADEDTPSTEVAAAIAQAVEDVSFVCCGDYSLDRGTGSVPAFLAAQLGARQALGLIEVGVAAGAVTALRRLDGGRRERLSVAAPAVVSVEGATATLRRASLSGALAARTAPITVLAGPVAAHLPTAKRPYRPRARVLEAPVGSPLERVKSLLGGESSRGGSSVPVAVSPSEAADMVLAALREWGYEPVQREST